MEGTILTTGHFSVALHALFPGLSRSLGDQKTKCLMSPSACAHRRIMRIPDG